MSTQDGPISLRVVYDHGVHVQGTVLWFDPAKPRDFAALSNARVPHSERQSKLLWSDRTARIACLSHGKKVRGLVTPFHRRFDMGPFGIELWPSGYLPGASQFRLTHTSGFTVTVSGPFSWQPSRTAERLEVPRSDTLVLDANYGHPSFRLPPRSEVYGRLVDWVRLTLRDDHVPIILAGTPGKAQDVIHLLGAETDTPIVVHRSIYEMNKVYRSIGVNLPRCRTFDGHPHFGRVLVWPAHLRGSPAIRNLKRARFLATSGIGINASATRRLRASVVLPWSARADFPDLIAYVDEARPKRIVTVGRHATDLATELQSRFAIPTEPLLPTAQLELRLG